MAGLVPAIHAVAQISLLRRIALTDAQGSRDLFRAVAKLKRVDGRNKSGHDVRRYLGAHALSRE